MSRYWEFLRILMAYPPFYLSLAYVVALHDFTQLSVGFVFGTAYYFLVLKIMYAMNTNACHHAFITFRKLSKEYRLDAYKAGALLSGDVVACFDPNENILLARFTIMNAVPLAAGTPPLFEANCFHISVRESVILTSFRGLNFPPLILYNLLHELKHGSDFGTVHSLQRIESVFRIWLLYFPLAMFTNLPAVWFAITVISFVHCYLELNYHHGEIASDIFAANVLSKHFGVERMKMVLRTLMRSMQLKLDNAITGNERNYARSRLAGFRKILAGNAPTKVALELNKVAADPVANRIMRQCRILVIIAGLLVYRYRAPVNLISLWIGCAWCIVLFIQYRREIKKYARNKNTYDWQLNVMLLLNRKPLA